MVKMITWFDKIKSFTFNLRQNKITWISCSHFECIYLIKYNISQLLNNSQVDEVVTFRPLFSSQLNSGLVEEKKLIGDI